MTNKQVNGINAAKRVLRVWQALKGHSAVGLSNTEICRITGESAPNVTRALNTLIEEGFVNKLENGRFAHGVKTLQIAVAHFDHVQRMRQRLDQTEAAIRAGAY